ncbi:MAG: cytochrome c oxidase subunit 3 [Holosporales bacterium]
MSTKAKKHPFHLVAPSPWPAVTSLASLVLTVGAVLSFHKHGSTVLYAGIIFLLLAITGWLRDVIKESKSEHTNEVRFGFKYGMALFIFSEVMFFVAFFWAYFNAALMPTEAIGNVWPPKNITTLDPFDLPYFNTLILLLSGTTLTWAHHALIEGRKDEALWLTGATIGLGLFFTCVQIYEYHHASFGFKDGIYASTFYMATGFHGAHVIIGTIFLCVAWGRIYYDHFTPSDHFGFEAAAWYWHFVDVVWLFLFVSIYWWGSGS